MPSVLKATSCKDNKSLIYLFTKFRAARINKREVVENELKETLCYDGDVKHVHHSNNPAFFL